MNSLSKIFYCNNYGYFGVVQINYSLFEQSRRRTIVHGKCSEVVRMLII